MLMSQREFSGNYNKYKYKINWMVEYFMTDLHQRTNVFDNTSKSHLIFELKIIQYTKT